MVRIGKDEGRAQVDRRGPRTGARIGDGTGMNGRGGHALGIASGHENGRESGRVRMPHQTRLILARSLVAAVPGDRDIPCKAGLAAHTADAGMQSIGPAAGQQRRGGPTHVYRSAQCQVRIDPKAG